MVYRSLDKKVRIEELSLRDLSEEYGETTIACSSRKDWEDSLM